jgi:hypothetical protein
LVIKRGSPGKGAFDIMMLFAACFNIFSNAFYSAFGMPDTIWFNVIDNTIEGLFWIDMILSFCQEYLDDETFVVVSDFISTAKHYLRGTFVVDFLACLPITFFFMFLDGGALKDAE